jgi:hypothetical protein
VCGPGIRSAHFACRHFFIPIPALFGSNGPMTPFEKRIQEFGIRPASVDTTHPPDNMESRRCLHQDKEVFGLDVALAFGLLIVR